MASEPKHCRDATQEGCVKQGAILIKLLNDTNAFDLTRFVRHVLRASISTDL